MGCGCKDTLIGKVGRSVGWSAAAIVPPTAPLLAGEIITGEMTFDCVVLGVGGVGRIEQIAIYEHATSGAPIEADGSLILYTKARTLAAGGSFAAPTTLTEIVQVIPVAKGNYIALDASNSVALISPSACEIKTDSGSTTLYGVLVATDTVTYGADAAVTVQLRIRRD